jgi:hypothetical protein
VAANPFDAELQWQQWLGTQYFQSLKTLVQTGRKPNGDIVPGTPQERLDRIIRFHRDSQRPEARAIGEMLEAHRADLPALLLPQNQPIAAADGDGDGDGDGGAGLSARRFSPSDCQRWLSGMSLRLWLPIIVMVGLVIAYMAVVFSLPDQDSDVPRSAQYLNILLSVVLGLLAMTSLLTTSFSRKTPWIVAERAFLFVVLLALVINISVCLTGLRGKGPAVRRRYHNASIFLFLAVWIGMILLIQFVLRKRIHEVRGQFTGSEEEQWTSDQMPEQDTVVNVAPALEVIMTEAEKRDYNLNNKDRIKAFVQSRLQASNRAVAQSDPGLIAQIGELTAAARATAASSQVQQTATTGGTIATPPPAQQLTQAQKLAMQRARMRARQ